MKHIVEQLCTPVVGEYGVIVAGGGIAGAAAALSAARCGCSVLLLERSYLTGGLATAGLIAIYLPLCDGMGQQVSFGMAEELLRLSVSEGDGGGIPAAWLEGWDPVQRRAHRFCVRFNPARFALLLEEALVRAGVTVLYGAEAVGVSVQDGCLKAVITQLKEGRRAFEAAAFVDATGDADLFALAGAPVRKHAKGNPLAAWYFCLDGSENELRQLGAADVPDDLKPLLGEPKRLSPRLFSGLCSEELADMTRLSHRQILADLRASRGRRVPTAVPTLPLVRMTRCIVGRKTMDVSLPQQPVPDCVGRIADWRRRGFVYDVPFGALAGEEYDNLFAAGRCISATDDMWDISRVIPACALTGEAAGAAAALRAEQRRPDVAALQEVLMRRCPRPDIEEGLSC